jgi:hypothetical protein
MREETGMAMPTRPAFVPSHTAQPPFARQPQITKGENIASLLTCKLLPNMPQSTHIDGFVQAKTGSTHIKPQQEKKPPPSAPKLKPVHSSRNPRPPHYEGTQASNSTQEHPQITSKNNPTQQNHSDTGENTRQSRKRANQKVYMEKKSNGHTTALGTQVAWLLKEGIVPNGMPNSKTSCINHVHVR